MAFGDPFGDPFGLGGRGSVDVFGNAYAPPRRRRRQQVVASPEEEESWIRSLASAPLSGLATIGTVFDTPGAFVRDIAAGNNPLEGVFNPSKRASGRDVLEAWGMAGPNDPNRWELADFAGFGLELGFDPLLPLALGGKALGTGGKLAKSSGLLDDLAKVAGPYMGKRQARIAHTLDDLIALRPGEEPFMEAERLGRAAAAAQQQGVKLADVLDQPLGGAASYFGMPIGTGARGQAVARGLDKAGDVLRWGQIPGTNFSPGSSLARLFHAPAGDATSRAGQQFIMPQLYHGGGAARAEARGVVANALDELIKKGGNLADEDQAMALRKIFEGVDVAPVDLEPMVKNVQTALEGLHNQSREWGVKVADFYDPKIGYFPRFMSTLLDSNKGQQAVASTFDESSLARLPFLKQIEGGTSTIADIARDPQIENFITSGAKTDDITSYIRSQYGHQVPDSFVRTLGQTKRATQIEFGSRPEAIAEWLQELSPEARQLGVFGNHPLQDLNVRLQNGFESLDTAKTVLTNLANPELMHFAHLTTKTPGQTVRLGQVLGQLGFSREEALTKYAGIAGMATDPDTLKQIARISVPKDLADDLTRYMEAFKGPKAVGEIIGVLDSITNLFKAGVTSIWPAFHTRNLGSGQFQNYVADMFSPRSVHEADQILRGGAADLRDLPIVQQVVGPGASPDQAQDLVRKLVLQHEVFGRYSGQTGEYGAAQALGAQGAGITDLLQQIPGGFGGSDPLELSKIPRMAAGMTPETDWNLLGVRGVGGRVESSLGPAVAGEHVGQYVEGLNRLSPFIHELRKGVSPAEAAKRVAAAQVDYGGRALTSFEREVMTRALPFYKFTRGAVPFALRQLWEAPGGRLAQTVRGINTMRGTDALTPPEVAEGTSIPLGQNAQGDPRYLTRLGLMFEDPLSLAGQAISNPRGAALELAGMLNPLIKGPAEYTTNQLFFQGGRPLDEAEGRVGRTIANILGRDEPAWDSRGGTGVLEQVVSNSPIARLSTALGTLTDRRKYDAYGAPLIANLLTGVKVTDVPQARQDAILRERLGEVLQSDLGGRTFQRAYVPADDLARMSPEEQQRVAGINALMALLQQRAKERRERAGR
ncbi:MAG: hypothetical protein U0836_18255 [Pirellulales bacterium]